MNRGKNRRKFCRGGGGEEGGEREGGREGEGAGGGEEVNA